MNLNFEALNILYKHLLLFKCVLNRVSNLIIGILHFYNILQYIKVSQHKQTIAKETRRGLSATVDQSGDSACKRSETLAI